MALVGTSGILVRGPVGRRPQLPRKIGSPNNNKPAIIRLPAWIKCDVARSLSLSINKGEDMGETQEIGNQ